MTTVYYSPLVTALDNSGRPILGATLTFYVSGSLNLATVFADAARLFPLPNPVTANAAGRFPAIYLDGATSYRQILRDGGGAPIPGGDVDPINGNDGSGNSASIYTAAATGAEPSDVVTRMQEGELSVLDFIPKSLHAAIRNGTSTYNCAPAFAKLKAALVAMCVATSYPSGAVGYVPAGVYPVTSIDWTNQNGNQFFRRIGLRGDGAYASSIKALIADQVLFNNVGRNYGSLEGISFQSYDVTSQCAILNSRTVASTSANNNHFRDVAVDGNYSKASVVSWGAESTTWLRCRFANAAPAGKFCCFLTGSTNSLSATPVTIATADVMATGGSPNTDNVMTDCEFYGVGTWVGTRNVVVFETAAGYVMQGCTVIGGGADNCRMVTYARGVGGVFNGPVTWRDAHMEVFGANNTVYWLEYAGASTWNNINSIGGNWVMDGGCAAVDYDRTVVSNQPALQGCTFTAPGVPNGAVIDAAIHAYVINDSSINWRMINGYGGIIAPGFVNRSSVTSNYLAIGLNLAGDATAYLGASSTVATFGAGQRIVNITPAVGGPASWLCTVSGTTGTLVGVTATTLAGSALIAVNTASGLKEGQRITIATAAGNPFYIAKIAGTAVYLTAVVSNAVTAQAVAYSPPTLVASDQIMVNRSGTAAFTAATTVAVPLTGEPDANYRIALTQYASSPLPPWITAKTAGGFTINFSAAFTGNVDWTLSR